MLVTLIAGAVGIFAGIATNWAFGLRASGWIWLTLCFLSFVLFGDWWVFLITLAYGNLHVVRLYPAE
jgi:hypothetical protein